MHHCRGGEGCIGCRNASLPGPWPHGGRGRAQPQHAVSERPRAGDTGWGLEHATGGMHTNYLPSASKLVPLLPLYLPLQHPHRAFGRRPAHGSGAAGGGVCAVRRAAAGAVHLAAHRPVLCLRSNPAVRWREGGGQRPAGGARGQRGRPGPVAAGGGWGAAVHAPNQGLRGRSSCHKRLAGV